MDRTEIQPLQILSLLPGRVRVHFPDWPRWSCTELEAHLSCLDGVRAVHANGLTGNVLIHFDPERLGIERLLRVLSAFQTGVPALRLVDGKVSAASSTLTRSNEGNPVARAVVRGALGHAAVDLLFYGATASAYALGWTWVGGLGAFHLVLDVFVWSAALLPLADELRHPHERWDMTRTDTAVFSSR